MSFIAWDASLAIGLASMDGRIAMGDRTWLQEHIAEAGRGLASCPGAGAQGVCPGRA